MRILEEFSVFNLTLYEVYPYYIMYIQIFTLFFQGVVVVYTSE